jgi:xanthine dehydrogenase accessory factor
VLTTRSLEIDVKYLPEIIKLAPRYIGVIGSKKRWIKTSELLLNNGIVESEIEKIFSPIGLDLKSETPEEIALSIMAEILKVKNDTSGENLRYFRRKRIDVE